MAGDGFRIVCEVEPATRPDLMRVRHQIGVMSRIASSFLIPDNHIGRATVSSIAVAHEVALMGGRSIACSQRPRPQRARLSPGPPHRCCVRRSRVPLRVRGPTGERAPVGRPDRPFHDRRGAPIRRRRRPGGPAAADRRHLPARSPPVWKQEADFLFVQVTFSVPALLDWRERVTFDGPVFAGVMAPASATMARKLSADIPELAVPQSSVNALDADRDAGVDFACTMVGDIRESGAFDGVHLIPVSR